MFLDLNKNKLIKSINMLNNRINQSLNLEIL